jgi:hypothetical protein
MNSTSIDQARAAKPHALEVFSAFAEVVGVGLTRIDDGYGLKVNLGTAPRDDATLPRDVDGVPVRVEVVGKIRKRLGE